MALNLVDLLWRKIDVILVGAMYYFAFVLFKLQKVIINPKSGYWVVIQKNRLAGSGKELVANRKRYVVTLIYK